MRTHRLVLTILMALAVTSACTKKGKVSSNGPGGGGGTGQLSLLKVFPTSQGETWVPITSGGRYYIKGLDLTIKGTCSRGIKEIQVVYSGTPYSQTASCPNTGFFTWSRTFTSGEEGDKTLTVQGVGVDGVALTDTAQTLDVRIDNTAPAAAVVTDPAATPYSYTGSSSTYVITGTVAADVVAMTGPGGVAITPSGGTWSYNATVIEGASTDYSFYTFDLAGNQSAVTTQTISWSPSVSMKFAGAFSGGLTTDGGTSFSIESSSGAVPSRAVDAGTSYFIETGMNYVTNQVRTDP